LPRRWRTVDAKHRDGRNDMKRLLLVFVLLILVVLAGGAVFLAFYDIPAPKQHMEVAVPNDKLAQ
jgi:hypothetical protein